MRVRFIANTIADITKPNNYWTTLPFKM